MTVDSALPETGASARTVRKAQVAERECTRHTVADSDSTGLPAVSVIVPTRNEASNVAELVRRLTPALAASSAEVIFVDDSDDDTPEVVAAVSRSSAVPVRLVHRPRGQRADGLGGAVLAGLRAAAHDWCVVMDGDLQHPPELVPALVHHGAGNDLELVVASRYTVDGDASGLADGRRVRVSAATTAMTRTAFPRRLRSVSDPMSGFFAVRRSSVALDSLRPIGFKILLEIAVRGGELRTGEIPFQFASRFAGKSKANLREGVRFARLVMRLWVASRMQTRAGRVAGFGAVGLAGILVNSLALMAAMAVGIHYLWAAVIATGVSTTFNWALLESAVFASGKPGSRLGRYIAFSLVNYTALLLRIPLLVLLVERLHAAVIPANIATLAVVFVLRFAISDTLIFGRRRAS